jgi:hypothetical protein
MFGYKLWKKMVNGADQGTGPSLHPKYHDDAQWMR